MNKEKKNKVLYAVALVIGIGFVMLLFLRGFGMVGAKGDKGYWTKWEDVTKCVAPCDSVDGTKTQERYYMEEECEYVCPVVNWTYKSTTYNVPYEKSEDPKKCHRPPDDTLKDTYGMDKDTRGEFKKDNKEWLEANKVCQDVVKDTESQEVKCEAELVACEEPTPIPTSTPEVTPTPTEEPKKEDKPSGCVNDCSVPAPQCSAEAVVNQPANPHVYRNGGTALVKWVPTDGNKANVYYKECSANGWQHAVQVDNTGYTEVHGLGNMDVCFGIEQVNDCSGGVITTAQIIEIVDGNTSRWTLFLP